MDLDVYIPRPGTHLTIDPGSGIVGTVTDTGRILVDYEGNRNGAVNLVTYADRVHIAAGRHADRYPTVARALLPADDLVRVGTFDTETGEIDLYGADESPDEARAAVASWCGIDIAAVEEQLRTAGSARHQMRREITAALASGNPAQRFAAEQMARRHHIDL